MKILVALYDRAIEGYGPIMTLNTRGEAIRSFREAVNEKGGNINKSPSDYELHVLGTYNDQTGEITHAPEKIARAEDLKE